MAVARDAAVAVSIFTTGDLLAQQIEHGTESVATFSADRTASASALGLIWGGGISPMCYRLNERLFPGRGPREVVKKIVINTALLGCVGNWCVIFGKRMLTAADDCTASWSERVRDTAQSVNLDWLTVMSHDIKVWPLTDVIIFTLIPIHLRVAFVSTVNVLWQSYLSYTASQGTAAAAASAETPSQLRRTLSRPAVVR